MKQSINLQSLLTDAEKQSEVYLNICKIKENGAKSKAKAILGDIDTSSFDCNSKAYKNIMDFFFGYIYYCKHLKAPDFGYFSEEIAKSGADHALAETEISYKTINVHFFEKCDSKDWGL